MSVDTVSEDTRLVLERRLAAPRERVWTAWTDPQALARWFGPEGVEVLTAEVELAVGARYAVTMRSADGEEHGVSGRYREICPPARLVFTWAWRTTPERESLVTVELADADGATLLTLTHERLADRDAAERHREGWSSSLDRLARACR